jgi:hypothetical protein
MVESKMTVTSEYVLLLAQTRGLLTSLSPSGVDVYVNPGVSAEHVAVAAKKQEIHRMLRTAACGFILIDRVLRSVATCSSLPVLAYSTWPMCNKAFTDTKTIGKVVFRRTDRLKTDTEAGT